MVSLGRHDGIDVQMEMASSDVHCVSALNSPEKQRAKVQVQIYPSNSIPETDLHQLVA